MKLEISIVLLLCVWATLAQDLLTPTLDLFRELKKINIMGERLNALNDEVKELRSMILNQGTVHFYCYYYYFLTGHTGETSFSFFDSMKRTMKGSSFHLLIRFILSLLFFFAARSKVAFSATLSSSLGSRYFGPHAEATTLAYENAFTNIGNAYDTNTGIIPLHKVV